MKRARIRLPAPHPKQREIEACQSKRILINAGRRAGKTFLVARRAIKRANTGRRELYAAPVNSQTDAFWELCTSWLALPILAGLVKKNEQKRTLLFLKSGGRIEARTAHKPDHLRGTWADDLYLDEFAYQHPETWEKVCQPMLADSGGTAMFISTPNTRNHFYILYLKALDREDWTTFTFGSLENPFLDKPTLDLMIKDMTDIDYRQEILAEFVPGVGAVFTLDSADFYATMKLVDVGVKHKGHRICAGLDWGRKNDFTVLSVGCADCMEELWLERTNQIEYHHQREVLKSVLRKFSEVELLAEENSIGLPNIEQLRLDGIDVQGFVTTNSSKGIIVQALRLTFTQHDWKWLDDMTAWNELEAFEMKIAPSGLAKYGAPEGLHDDTVMARMLMLRQATQGQLQFY